MMGHAIALDAPEPVSIAFAGHSFIPLASGALYWPAENTLLVADLHLEKHAAFAARGQFLPPYDTGLTLMRLARDIAQTRASRVVALGDSFHRNESPSGLQAADRAHLDALLACCDWLWLSGNHDPAPHRLGGRCLTGLEHAGLTLTHEPRRGVPGMIAGHLHPAARVLINGRTVRRGCFVHDTRLMILPAYGASTGNLNILSPAFAGLFDRARLEVTMIGRDRLYPVGAKRLVAG